MVNENPLLSAAAGTRILNTDKEVAPDTPGELALYIIDNRRRLRGPKNLQDALVEAAWNWLSDRMPGYQRAENDA